jgi:hypothetical protein
MRPASTTFEAASCGDANRASVYAQDALLPPATQGASEDRAGSAVDLTHRRISCLRSLVIVNQPVSEGCLDIDS